MLEDYRYTEQVDRMVWEGAAKVFKAPATKPETVP